VLHVFGDPISATYNTAVKSLPAISRGPDSSVYRLDDSGVIYTLQLGHQYKTRNRFTARLTRDAIVPDPRDDEKNVAESNTVMFTVDTTNGALPADASLLAQMLVDWLTDANILKLVGGET